MSGRKTFGCRQLGQTESLPKFQLFTAVASAKATANLTTSMACLYGSYSGMFQGCPTCSFLSPSSLTSTFQSVSKYLELSWASARRRVTMVARRTKTKIQTTQKIGIESLMILKTATTNAKQKASLQIRHFLPFARSQLHPRQIVRQLQQPSSEQGVTSNRRPPQLQPSVARQNWLLIP